MIEQNIAFFSEGFKLDGSLYLPDDYQEGERRPLIVVNSGFQGFNAFYPNMFSGYLTQYGFVCLGFDYRGFAKSEGPRGRVILPEQVVDIKNAITYGGTRPEVDPERIGLLGWGMGASNVVMVTATDERAQAVAAVNGFHNGERWLKSIHTEEGWQNILKAVEEDRVRRVTTGKSKRVSPFIHYTLDPSTEAYVQKELSPLIEQSGSKIDLEFTESVIACKSERMALLIAPRPLFIAHGKDNSLHPKAEAEALYAAAREPKTLYWIDGRHNDFAHTGNPVLERLIDRLAAFFAVL
jgi:alpha/beta superfamily hydrolase